MMVFKVLNVPWGHMTQD